LFVFARETFLEQSFPRAPFKKFQAKIKEAHVKANSYIKKREVI
jgi:hypothetical protein